jgi:hypothetical protein
MDNMDIASNNIDYASFVDGATSSSIGKENN